MKTFLGTFYGKNLFIEADIKEAIVFANRLNKILAYYPPTTFWGKVKWLLIKQK